MDKEFIDYLFIDCTSCIYRGRGGVRMVVGFTNYAIDVYHH